MEGGHFLLFEALLLDDNILAYNVHRKIFFYVGDENMLSANKKG